MSQPYSQTEEQFLRRAFDAAYSFRLKDLIHSVWSRLRSMNRRTLRIVLLLIGSTLVAIGLVQGLRTGLEYANWATRPSFAERLAAPYDLDLRPLPNVDTSEFYVLPGKVGEYQLVLEELVTSPPAVEVAEVPSGPLTLADLSIGQPDAAAVEVVEAAAPEATGPLSLDSLVDSVVVEPVLPAEDGVGAVVGENGEILEAVVEEAPKAPALDQRISLCMLLAGNLAAGLEADCPTFMYATYVETAPYMGPEDQQVRVTVANFADEYSARMMLQLMQDYSRTFSLMGNFARLEEAPVHYFFSTVGGTATLNWAHGTWLFSVTGPNFNSVDQFLSKFSY